MANPLDDEIYYFLLERKQQAFNAIVQGLNGTTEEVARAALALAILTYLSEHN